MTTIKAKIQKGVRRNWTDAAYLALGQYLRDGLTGREVAVRLNAEFPMEMQPKVTDAALWEFIRANGGREAVMAGERRERAPSGRTSAGALAVPFAAQLAVIEDEVFHPSTVVEAQWAADGARLWGRDPLTWEQVHALLKPGHARSRDYGFYVKHPDTGRMEPVYDALLDEWMTFDEIVRRGRAYFTLGALLSEAA